MQFMTPAIACALFLISAPGFAQVRPPKVTSAPALAPLTLQEALARAALTNPALRAKQAQLDATTGARTEANALLFNNPQLSTEQTRRKVPQPGGGDARRSEWGAGLSQAFETGGQGRFRREATGAALDALRYEIADTQRQVRSDVTSRFYRVLTLQQRIDLETQALKLFDDAATAVEKRRRAGEDTKLDANVALVEAERARNQLALAQEQLIEARSDLAALLQMAGSVLPQAQAQDLAPVAPEPRRKSSVKRLCVTPAPTSRPCGSGLPVRSSACAGFKNRWCPPSPKTRTCPSNLAKPARSGCSS